MCGSVALDKALRITAFPDPPLSQHEPALTSRRLFLIGVSALALTACSSTGRRSLRDGSTVIQVDEPWASYYSAKPNEPFPVPAIDLRRVPQQYWRQEVESPGNYAPGTLVVSTSQRYLYLILSGGRAMRYGVGVG